MAVAIGINCFKPYDERASTARCLQSDADEQLILFVPFTGAVTLRSIAGNIEARPVLPDTSRRPLPQ